MGFAHGPLSDHGVQPLHGAIKFGRFTVYMVTIDDATTGIAARRSKLFLSSNRRVQTSYIWPDLLGNVWAYAT